MKKMSPFGWLIIKALLLQTYIKVKTFFLKPNIKESYKYQHATYPIYLTLMKKTNLKRSTITEDSQNMDYFLFGMN